MIRRMVESLSIIAYVSWKSMPSSCVKPFATRHFVSLNGSIYFIFNFVNLFTTHGVAVWWEICKCPCFVMFQGCEFCIHCFLPSGIFDSFIIAFWFHIIIDIHDNTLKRMRQTRYKKTRLYRILSFLMNISVIHIVILKIWRQLGDPQGFSYIISIDILILCYIISVDIMILCIIIAWTINNTIGIVIMCERIFTSHSLSHVDDCDE